jgi:HTH-type transcriptional dual regulator CecR, C-terminal domain
LVASITKSTSTEINRLRTLLILGQIHWMNARREEVFRIMRWSKLDTAKLSMIKQTVREHTRLVLNGIGTLPTASPNKLKPSLHQR